MKVAYLGPENTFTGVAVRKMFPTAELVDVRHIKEIVLAVENGSTDMGVLPYENIVEGHVTQSLDALTKYLRHAQVVRELALPIVHCFGALKNHRDILEIYSKDQALSQCDEWLSDHYPNAEPISVSSTATAAQRIISENLVHAAAIASKRGLKGLEVLAEDILPGNRTRFFAIGKAPTPPTGDDKTLLALHPSEKDKPGLLYHSLSPIELLGINMGDILSRPDRKIIGRSHYFVIEIMGHESEVHVMEAVREIKAYLDIQNKFPDAVRVLGSYPNSHWEDEERWKKD